MAHTIADIAAAIGAEAVGAVDLTVDGAAEPAVAGPSDIAVALSPAYAEALGQGRARAALLWADADWQALGLDAAIRTGASRTAMAPFSRALDPGRGIAPGVHPSAVVDPTAEIGPGAAIAPLAVVGPGARIGANVVLGPGATIGADARLGDDCVVMAGAHVGPRCRTGDRLVAQPGAVIGGDGFSFVTAEATSVDRVRSGDEAPATGALAEGQAWTRVHSLGAVVIGDDCDLGANACVDRGTIRDTVLGDGVKIDNLTQVGHNCVIGDHVMLCGMVGVAGSVRIGDRVVLGGKVGVSDNIFIGDDVVAGGGTNIYTNVPAGRVILGSPATKMATWLEITRNWRRLPRLVRRVEALEKAVSTDRRDD